MRFHTSPFSDASPDGLGLCGISSSKSSTEQKTEVTDNRAGASGGSIAATSGAIVRVEDLSDEALRELLGLGALTIQEGVALAGQGLAFADDQSKAALNIQSESLRLVEGVLERDQEPGFESTRNALIAMVAVVALIFVAPKLFKGA